jgi:hypothetical protein
LGSDRCSQLLEHDRHPPACRRPNRQFVVTAADILDQGVPGDDDPGAAVVLEPAHRPQPRFQPAMIGLERLLAYRSVRCHAAGSNSSSTIG